MILIERKNENRDFEKERREEKKKNEIEGASKRAEVQRAFLTSIFVIAVYFTQKYIHFSYTMKYFFRISFMSHMC